MEEERLARIPAHSNARRVNYRQAHLVATLVCEGARFTKPALPIPRAFGTDLGGGLETDRFECQYRFARSTVRKPYNWFRRRDICWPTYGTARLHLRCGDP